MKLLILLLMTTISIFSANGWYLHSNWGYMHSMDSVLSVHSTDGDIVHRASWESKAFKDSPYYTLRLEQWDGDNVSGFEWVHHKIYLKNNPTTIDNLSVSDGYNILL